MQPHHMTGSHDTPLVALSIFVAICASYTALSLAGRVAVTRGRTRAAWLLGGSIAMGSGIWSMHFVAMLAYHLPDGIPIVYDVPLVGLSHFAGVAASAFALFVASRETVSKTRLVSAGQILGLAIVTMHYTGMAAVRVPNAVLGYDNMLVGASVLIAVGAATVALGLFIWLRNDVTRRGRALRALSAVVMGLAISGMHYTGMAAAHFSPTSVPTQPSGFLMGTGGLAIPVAIGALVILALTLLGSIADHWLRAKLAAAEALRESEERYRSVVSEIGEVIFRADAAGRWTFLNSAWTQITGFSTEKTIGQPIVDSAHPEDRDKVHEHCPSLKEGKADHYEQEMRYLTADGGSRWVEIHARALRSPSGIFLGTAGVIRDVTERHRAEEALRTAREAAEAASRAKSEFLSRMSHELRTPLNAILGFGQLMELDAKSADEQENATQILKGGRHLLSLINEVLDITGIESGKLHLSAEPVLVSEVVDEVLSLMMPLAATRHIQLTADGVALSGRYAQADRQRLKQVLLNLVANAVKYNRDGGIAHIALARAPEDRVKIVVSDNGPGIAEAKLSRLFKPFERLGLDQNVEGTGLGLMLCKRLVEAMQGEIGVESAPGAGSRFWVELPRAESPIAHAERTSGANIVEIDEVRRGKILYVEDNLSNLTLMQRILSKHERIELIPAMSGGLALDLARLHQPDLILLDLHLPDIPGEEVLRQLRQEPPLAGIPIVVLSADATPTQIERLKAAGAFAYLTKPLDLKVFTALLDEVLDVTEAV
jgi:PAS domain S-box-containing protein